MRMQLLKIVVVLLVAGSGDTRPQNGADSQAKMIERSDAGWRGIQVSSKSHDIVQDDSSGQLNNTHRDLKDLQYMDQSLRTVATQLLNVTHPQDVITANNKELIKGEYNVATTPKSLEKNTPSLVKDASSEVSNLEPVSFGRPINSKFSYFETSHPGQAMAMTEEELEREMSTTRLITAHKSHPTTTGGISTWILLNPPSTTVKSTELEKMKTQQPFQTEVRLTVRPSSTIEKVETIPQLEKIAEKTTSQLTPIITTEKVITKKPTATTTKKVVTSTLRPEKTTQDSGKAETSSSTTLKVIRTTTTSTSTTSDGTTTLTTVLTTKKSQPQRTTSKPKVTTPRTTSHSKPTTTKPPKPKPTRKTTIKPETVKNETSASTGKIEKVTFKPVPIITTPQNKPENTERPMFVTKIKASVLMDTQKTPTTLLPATTATTLSASTTSNSNLSSADLVEVPVRSKPTGTKVNNVLKVQLKKPVDETTQIEIEPIKVNMPILKIEKVDKSKMDEIVMKDTDDFNDSRIDLKFDFNPELTKINVETQTEVAATTSTAGTTASTTKRPRHNSKRKKNKTRRRKPTTSVPSSTTVAMPILMETNEGVTDPTYMDNAVQESKIAPETKVAANTTKTKKKQPQKAISTQIYNFLSREVMPSFGVMSLVGLGLGLASYFLYPFGSTITRRNYEVEPNYKYNMDEYGGNYGQSEEEMLSKVFQGMTNYENKYPGGKDNYNDNYYHYQRYDGAYDTQTTKKADPRYPSTSPGYKTVENTQPVKYRNTDFRYAEAQTTPVYYDRKRPDLVAEVDASSAANRQFVVGNVPKEYPFDVKVANLPMDSKKGVGYMSTEVGHTQFDKDAQDFDFPNAAALHGYGYLGASTIRPDDGYEEIEITPTAVAVEHGPRSLKVKRAAVNEAGGGRRRSLRSKRESVIQIIPSKRELEEEREEVEKEEDLSNEILDIIDSALPGGEEPHKRGSENNEVEDLEGQKRKQEEEANTRAKTSTLKTTVEHTEATTEIPTTFTIGKMTDDTSVSSENSFDKEDITHPTDAKIPEATTVEWFDSSTTNKPSGGFSLLNFVKKVAEIKFRLGLTILKHASEGFARYLGHVQKRINGEE